MLSRSNVQDITDKTKSVCDNAFAIAHGCEHQSVLVNDAIQKVFGTPRNVLVKGSSQSGKSTLIGVLLQEGVCPHTAQGVTEIRYGPRSCFMVTKGGVDNAPLCLKTDLGSDSIANTLKLRETMKKIPLEYQDGHWVMWHPIKASSVLRNCLTTELHSGHNVPSDVTILVLKGPEDNPHLDECADVTNLFVVVNFPKSTEDRQRIASLCRIDPSRVYFVDCVRVLADILLPASDVKFTPKSFGGEFPRLERDLLVATQTPCIPEQASAMLQEVSRFVESAESGMKEYASNLKHLKDLCNSVEQEINSSNEQQQNNF